MAETELPAFSTDRNDRKRATLPELAEVDKDQPIRRKKKKKDISGRGRGNLGIKSPSKLGRKPQTGKNSEERKSTMTENPGPQRGSSGLPLLQPPFFRVRPGFVSSSVAIGQ